MSRSKQFSFGQNWAKFLDRNVDEEALAEAKRSLQVLGPLQGKTFLDLGSGSGLFSWSAHELGAARIVSVDIDPASVACTRTMRDRAGAPAHWTVLHGSAIEDDFMATLEPADVVYAWGSLHHTGRMWHAIKLACGKVAPGGSLFLSIYNRHPSESELWVAKKRRYNTSGTGGKLLMKARHVGGHLLTEYMLGNNPISVVMNYGHGRGMNYFRDLEDWLGGEPYEYANVEEITEFCERHGFERTYLDALEGTACNEFMFTDRSQSPARYVAPFAPDIASSSDEETRYAAALITYTQGERPDQELSSELYQGAVAALARGKEASLPEGLAALELPTDPHEMLAGASRQAARLAGVADTEPLVRELVREIQTRHVPGQGWGLGPSQTLCLQSMLSSRGELIPDSYALIDEILAGKAPSLPSGLLCEAFSLGRAIRQSSHRSREVRDRMRETADLALAALESASSLSERAALLAALAEVQAVLPAWIRSPRPLRSPLDVVPWFSLES
jgi:SAM-dependent methyltransferase